MFDNIVGHDYNKKVFTNILNRGKENLSHAYIFVGNNHLGKRTFAEAVADQIVGVKRNLYIIEPEKETISIDKIRDMQNDIALPPVNGFVNKKVVIIDEADKMNESAQNALLKTLEEPPEYVTMFLIVSDMNRLLQTIRSRGTVISFMPLPDALISEILSEKRLEKPFESFCMVYINGSYSKARELIESNDKVNEYSELYEVVSEILDFKLKKDDYTFAATHNYLVENSAYYNDYFTALINYISKMYYSTSEERYFKVNNVVTKAYKDIKSGANYSICIMSMLLNISKLNKSKKG